MTRNIVLARIITPGGACCFAMAVCVFAAGLTLGGQASFAAHHHNLPSKMPVDPCVKPKGDMTRRIEQMKILNKAVDAEKSAPNTLAGVFQLMQGKTYIDHDKVEQLTRARLEANDLNRLLHGMGCTTVDIDEELTKPPVVIVK